MSGSDYCQPAADVKFTQPGVGYGDMLRLFPCTHKGTTTGAQWHKGLGMYIRCAACNAARREGLHAFIG